MQSTSVPGKLSFDSLFDLVGAVFPRRDLRRQAGGYWQ